MALRIKIIGRDWLTGKFRRLPLDQLRGMSRVLALSGLDVQTEARRSIQKGTRSGMIVMRGGRTHQRSAKGEAPKTDTGRLVSNIFSILDADEGAVEIGTDLKYGRYLEFGTSRMAARPWLHPAYERLKPRIRRRFAQTFRQANRAAAK